MWCFLVWLLSLFKSGNDIEDLEIRSQVYSNWINFYLKPDHISIDKIDNIIDGKNLNTLVEQLWSDKIEIEIDPNLNEKEQIIENFHQVLQYLQTQKVNIPDFKLYSVIEKKNLKDLLNIIWSIISHQKIDNIYFNGFRGRKGLLMWINKFTDKLFFNFTDSWDNGKTICKILSKFYPNDINLSMIEQINNTNYTISLLQKVNAPLLVDYESFNKLDENSSMLQYAILFDFLSYPFKVNSNYTENIINHHKANYIYCMYDNPFYYDEMILDKDIPNYITENNQVIQKINDYFGINMHSRKPVQIAYIKNDGNDFKIDYDFPAFEKVLKRAGLRPILFVSCTGRYQQGKTTIDSGITGNLGYKLGNGHRETTKGVYIDGPYDINYLYDRFEVSMRKDIYFGGNELLSPLIFFFDIEGYEGNMHGNDIEKNNKAYIEMSTPFLCLSSIFIFLSEPNANSNEIKNFFERVKVSKLTTYSNNDTNGELQLHIVFNRYNKILNDLDDKRPNLKLAIKKFQERMKKEWIGVQPLNQYGIKYNFFPIIDGLPPYYKNGLFFEVFRYFVKNIIRSIEDAAEGRFMRSAEQSLNLFNFVIEHHNDKNFEELVKLLIKSDHENSFETFSKKAYKDSQEKIFFKIDKKFAKYYKNNIFDIDINNSIYKYTKSGEEEIKNYLKPVQDHQSVFDNIQKLVVSIRNKVYEKYDNLIKHKYKLIEEFNNRIEQKADKLASDSLDKIYSELTLNDNYNFNQSQIDNCIKREITNIVKVLYEFKQKENLFLLSDQVIDTIIPEKQLYLESNVDSYIHNEKIVADQIREENDMKLICIKLYKKKIKDEYDFKEKQLINDLNAHLRDKQFYADNFKHIIEICQQTQTEIINDISSKQNLIIDDIVYNLCQNNENTSKIVERLKQKNALKFDNIILQSLINENKDELYSKIHTEFARARLDLSITRSFNRTTEESYFKEKVEIQQITYYPDGTNKVGKWETIRIKYKPFSKIAKDTVDPLINIAKKVFDIL